MQPCRPPLSFKVPAVTNPESSQSLRDSLHMHRRESMRRLSWFRKTASLLQPRRLFHVRRFGADPPRSPLQPDARHETGGVAAPLPGCTRATPRSSRLRGGSLEGNRCSSTSACLPLPHSPVQHPGNVCSGRASEKRQAALHSPLSTRIWAQVFQSNQYMFPRSSTPASRTPGPLPSLVLTVTTEKGGNLDLTIKILI
ncbi:hypothetical protein T484DRAFT_1749117 [Baffinella frigidus]|nr:hypothetical protein T484DRAFT_1749117 [Cryptophyta sp. CCMP2293]